MKTESSIRLKSVAFIMTALFLCAAPDAALSQPPNDNFVNAIVLTGVSGQTTGTNVDATLETGEGGGVSVWWKWTAPETGAVYFDTHGSTFDTVLAVYTGSSVNGLTQIARNDDDGKDYGNSSLAFRAETGTNYYIAVDGYEANSGSIILNWRKADPPANDNFANATVLTGITGQTTGSNINATPEGESTWYVKSVWWKWTAPETGAFYFDTHGSNFGTTLTVYIGSAVDSLTEIAVNGYDGSDNSSLAFRANAGTVFYIAVYGNDSYASGEIVLNWRKANPLANDNFADAAVLTGVSGQTTGSNIDATSETGEVSTWCEYGKSVWWKWTAPETGAFYFDTHGSSFDTYLAVYTGSAIDSLTNIADNDDVGNGSLVFRAETGTRYYISVDGRETGNIVLNWRKSSVPPNDFFADAIELTGISGNTTGTNIDATSEPGENGSGKSVWYSWTATETGAVYFDTHGSSFNTYLAVYTGSAVDSLTRIADNYDDGSDNGNSSLAFRAETGTRYYIAVDRSEEGISDSIVLNWRKANSPANDDFANAAVLTGVSGNTNGSNIEATSEPGEPFSGGKSVWYSWTAPETDIFYFDTDGSSFNTVVYTGSAVDSLTWIAQAQTVFQAQAGTRYNIAVDGSETGNIVLNWNRVIPRTAGNFEMELSGRAFIEGERIESSDYIILAFGPGGVSDCRGKGKFIRLGEERGYILTIVSDIDGEEIGFRIADSSTGQIYDISGSIIFEAGTSANKDLDKPLKADSVYPALGETGKSLNVTVSGFGFDENTKVLMYPDMGNSKSIIGSVDTPEEAHDVAASGTTAYVAGDSGLQIIDVSDPENPHIISSVGTGYAVGLAVSGTTVYVAGYSGLQIIAVKDAANPQIIGTVDTPGYAQSVAVSGTTAYLVGDGLQIIDIKDPANPQIIGSADTPGYALGVAVSGTFAYVADGDSGLQIIDIRDPAKPRIIGSAYTPGEAQDVAVSGTTAYVAAGYSDLQIIDVKDPEKPEIIASVDTQGDVAVSGTTVYVADPVSGLQIIDVKDPAKPRIICSVVTPGHALSVAVSGTTAYVTDRERWNSYSGSQLHIIDVSNPTTIIGSADTRNRLAWDVAVSGTFAYIADSDVTDGKGGLQIIDIKDPANPEIIGSVATPGEASDAAVSVSGTTAYVANWYGGLQIIDVKDPANPQIIGSIDTLWYAKGVAVSGTTAYVADGDSGLQIIDVKDPAKPRIIGSIDTPGFAEGVVVSGAFAYVADSDSGLQIIDIKDPANPRIISSIDMPGSARDVAVSGTTAYVADGDSVLQIIDIRDPAKPQIIGSLERTALGYAFDVAVSGTTAYVADGYESGLQIIDISDPVKPQSIGSIDTLGGQALGVAVSDGKVYVAARERGLL
ncbi:MAG: hypothetical protein BWK80_59135, partial [Desulfobacteraceae bacterium IS3]